MVNTKLALLVLLLAPACAVDTEEQTNEATSAVSWEHDGHFGNFGATMLETDGSGFGWVNVHSYPNGSSTFSATITVQLSRVSPNTMYTIQRAPEVGLGRALTTDGICQRAAGVAPWDDGTPSYVPFGITITTNPGGHGFTRFDFNAPGIATGAAFDVQFRAFPTNSTNSTSIVSDCFTVTPQ